MMALQAINVAFQRLQASRQDLNGALVALDLHHQERVAVKVSHRELNFGALLLRNTLADVSHRHFKHTCGTCQLAIVASHPAACLLSFATPLTVPMEVAVPELPPKDALNAVRSPACHRDEVG